MIHSLNQFRSLSAITGVFVFTVLLAMPAEAVVNWDHTFLLDGSGGVTDATVLFGFNPQPDPPVSTTFLTLPSPSNPTLTIPGVSNPAEFDVFFAIGSPSIGGGLTVAYPTIPNLPFDSLSMEVFSPPGAGTPVKLFDVFLDFTTSSGGQVDGLKAVSFNPQPDPPIGQFGVDSDFGMNFSFTSLSDASVTLRVQDALGNQLAFAEHIPEPASMTLLASGLLFMGLRRRRLADL